jgi:glycerate kinase
MYRVMASALVCPDKFKGTLTARAAAAALAAGLRRAGLADVREVPLADGGEGTLDLLVETRGGSRRRVTVTGPLGEPVEAEWAMLPGGVAVVEMARASGLALVSGRNDPLRASTRGTGELIAAALRAGARHVVVGLGGSATTDGGLAAVEALGWSFGKVRVTAACDVTTTFVDAARVFGPQKGAGAAEVDLLTRRLERLAEMYAARTGEDVRALDGAGAAGGLAGGLAAIGAELVPGFDVVAEVVGLDDVMEGVDLVVTGEGRLDEASFDGKVVGGVVERARELEVPSVAVVAGQVTPQARARAEADGIHVYALTDRVWQSGDAFARAALLVEEAADEAGRAVLGAADPRPDQAESSRPNLER